MSCSLLNMVIKSWIIDLVCFVSPSFGHYMLFLSWIIVLFFTFDNLAFIVLYISTDFHYLFISKYTDFSHFYIPES